MNSSMRHGGSLPTRGRACSSPKGGIRILLAILFLMSNVSVTQATENESASIAVVAMPRGAGHEAAIARALIPSNIDGIIELVPLDQLMNKTTLNVEMLSDAHGNEMVLKQQALQAALSFELVKAAELRRQAADGLLASDALATRPGYVASFLLDAAAASIEAGQSDLALIYFRKALAIDADLELDARFSPQAKSVFSEAIKEGPAEIAVPTDEVLEQILTQHGWRGILWIAVGRNAGRNLATEKIALRGGGPPKPETRLTVPVVQTEQNNWISGEKARIKKEIASALGLSQSAEKPWYKKWWVYAASGGVIAAGIVTAVVVSFAGRPETAQIVVHY